MKKIVLILISGAIAASGVIGGVLSTLHKDSDAPAYDLVPLKVWNDVSHDSTLTYQSDIKNNGTDYVTSKMGYHKTHHYNEAIALNSSEAKPEVMNLHTFWDDYHGYGDFHFHMQMNYAAGDTLMYAPVSSHSNSGGDFLKTKIAITNVIGFSIRARGNYINAHQTIHSATAILYLSINTEHVIYNFQYNNAT